MRFARPIVALVLLATFVHVVAPAHAQVNDDCSVGDGHHPFVDTATAAAILVGRIK